MTTEPTPAASTSENITRQPEVPLPRATPETLAPTSSAVPAPAWVLKSDYLLLGLLLLLSFCLASFVATNADIWMHLAIGQRLSEGQFEFGVDPYSWATEATATSPAVYWVHHSWLYSWLFYQLYQLVGGAGLVFGKALIFTIAIGLLSRIGWSGANRWFLIICLVMATLAVSTRIVLQPIVVSLLFLSLTLVLLDRAGVFRCAGSESKPACMGCLWVLPPLFALWANLDAWFILGPLVVGICWLGNGMSRWFMKAAPVSGKTLGLVFIVGTLACLANPYHVRVFQLPAELAYLVLRLGEPLRIPLPNEWVGAGRTLKELRRADAGSVWTMSSVTPQYWWDIRLGKNIAGIAFYPLLVLGLLSFILVAPKKSQANAPSLHVTRFLLWLIFAVMALALFRMIPFFVLIAAPLTALTLGEFLLWEQDVNAITAARRDRGLRMARFVSVPFLLLLLYLAWPGWLHGTTEFNSPRRVAWGVRADASLQQAAESLQSLEQPNESRRVFNLSYDFAYYCPTFAPRTKFFMDTRFSLYPDQAAAFMKVRQALVNPTSHADDWQTFFEDRKIDQLVLTNFAAEALLRWWLDADRWRQRYGDNRTMVLSWAGPNRTWPANTLLDDWNRQAFGAVPVERRPPGQGTMPAASPTFWTLYVDGVGPQPPATYQFNVLLAHYRLNNQIVSQEARWYGMAVLSAAAAQLQAMPGDNVTMAATVRARLNEWFSLRALDYGPPALPILMVRLARQAVAENPLDPQSHMALIEANETLRRDQEDYWTNQQATAKMRERLRQVQLVTGLYNAAQLQPENFKLHSRLAQLYKQQNMNDLALEHMRQVEKGLEAWKASGARDVPKDVEAGIKQFQREIDSVDKDIRKRLAKWQSESGGKTALQKAAYAFAGLYQEPRGERIETTPLGLGKKALEILDGIKLESLTAEEIGPYYDLMFELLVRMGRADVVAETLKKEPIRTAFPPARLAQYQLIAGGAIGDYEAVDQAAVVLEKVNREAAQYRRLGFVPALFVAPTLQAPGAYAATIAARSMLQYDGVHEQYNEVFNIMTLRGIAALEAGDTERARTTFDSALKEAEGTYYFTERPIAKRYSHLLNQQKNR